MKRFWIALMALGAVFLAASLSPADVALANHPNVALPLLSQCPDVNGDGTISGGDISKIVSKFGTNSTNLATYRLLYDISTTADGAVTGGDISAVVARFGINTTQQPGKCMTDYQIAAATLAIMDSTYSNMTYCGGNCGGDAQFLTENASFLATKSYYRASTDVPGQGVHYVNYTYFTDNIFNPTKPEGLVYDNGRLAAQLYFVNGGAVGWGPEPPPPDQVDIDAFCTPISGQTACSWANIVHPVTLVPMQPDRYHVHFNLCTVAIGTPDAAAIPGVSSQAQCDSLQNTYCSGPCGGTHTWNARVGWMSHLWNHLVYNDPAYSNTTIEGNPANVEHDLNGNGRFADCYPDTGHYGAWNCPQ
jgi:hypothetical protein